MHDDDGAQKTDANVDGPALLPSVGSKQARRAPPHPPPHNLPPSPRLPTQDQLKVSHIMILLSFQTVDPLSSQIA